MPHLDAAALTADPEGTDFLRKVLDVGEDAIEPSRSAFIPTSVPHPAASLRSESLVGLPVLAIADAA